MASHDTPSKRKRDDQQAVSSDDERIDADEMVEEKRQRTIGPAMPPGYGQDSGNSEDESSSDDDVGPSLPGASKVRY